VSGLAEPKRATESGAERSARLPNVVRRMIVAATRRPHRALLDGTLRPRTRGQSRNGELLTLARALDPVRRRRLARSFTPSVRFAKDAPGRR
jgi:hypothetical protein